MIPAGNHGASRLLHAGATVMTTQDTFQQTTPAPLSVLAQRHYPFVGEDILCTPTKGSGAMVRLRRRTPRSLNTVMWVSRYRAHTRRRKVSPIAAMSMSCHHLRHSHAASFIIGG